MPSRPPGLPGTRSAGRASLVTRAPEPVPESPAARRAWLDSTQLHPSSTRLTAGPAPGAPQPSAGCTAPGTGVPVAAAGLKQEGPSLWPSLPLSWPLTHQGEEPAEPVFHNTPQRRRGQACTRPESVGAVAGSLWEPRSPCQGAPLPDPRPSSRTATSSQHPISRHPCACHLKPPGTGHLDLGQGDLEKAAVLWDTQAQPRERLESWWI